MAGLTNKELFKKLVLVCGSQLLTAQMFRVYIALYTHLGENNYVYPSYPTIARESGLKDIRCAKDNIQRLVKIGALTKIKQFNPKTGYNLSNTYEFNDPEIWLANASKTSSRYAKKVDTSGYGTTSVVNENSSTLMVTEPLPNGYGTTTPNGSKTTTLMVTEPLPNGYGTTRTNTENQLSEANSDELNQSTNSVPPFGGSADADGLADASRDKQPTDDLLPSEDGIIKPTCSSYMDLDMLNSIAISATKIRFTELLVKWNREIGSPLSQASNQQIIAACKVLAKEEQITGKSLRTDLIIPAAKNQGMSFLSLFKPSGSSFVWIAMQEAASSDMADPKETLQTPEAVSSPSAVSVAPEAPKKRRKAKDGDQWSNEDVEKIYNEYPRKEKKSNSLISIRNALTTLKTSGTTDPVGYLIGRVALYAKARNGQDRQFTPHPTSWFNQQRYLDDETNWFESVTDKTGNAVRIIKAEPSIDFTTLSSQPVPESKSMSTEDMLKALEAARATKNK